jgi:hypothetical protein
MNDIIVKLADRHNVITDVMMAYVGVGICLSFLQCVEAEPNRGEIWNRVSKMPRNLHDSFETRLKKVWHCRATIVLLAWPLPASLM